MPRIPSCCSSIAASAAFAVVAVVAGSAAAGGPVTETLEPVADTTLFDSGETSNGAGDRLFAGVTGSQGGFTKQRSPMRFDLSGIPADATIIGATLTVTLVQANPVTGGDDPYELRRVLAAWGEAGAVAVNGLGAPAQPGDATWTFAFFPGEAWATAGGDLAAAPSASRDIGIEANSTWTFSDPLLVADVAAWVAGTQENHGWALMGDESLIWTARKFGSREAVLPSQRPALTVTWEPGVACGGDLDGSGAIDFGDLLAVLSNFGPCDQCPEDLDVSGAVDFGDLLLLLANFGGCLDG